VGGGSWGWRAVLALLALLALFGAAGEFEWGSKVGRLPFLAAAVA